MGGNSLGWSFFVHRSSIVIEMFDFILRPLRRRFGKDKAFYAAIDDMFGFIPHNIELYKLALIHKSASIELEDGRHINNERLEFLGDAVIESVTQFFLLLSGDSDTSINHAELLGW